MLSLLLCLSGVAATFVGAVRTRRVPGRDDEVRWHGFLLLLLGLAFLVLGYAQAVSG